eukprot:CAMPEP_0181294928 /NCGR_PEP_ID=MMETSP1101-20121128/3868_1 /TAXON_ID=46948 /ORGANISM="Rhodomonas abbreviata, Strain Caron Lab Isolate" /LENGTH=348 /DNA_ID=CAMNT_0023399631 /DNA_START=131 /DNA_END=1177 /DNA_ORIENTATION=+
MPKDLELAIVTGGNRGIGLAIVQGLWKTENYHTIIACRSVSSGETAVKEVRGMPGSGELTVMQLDLCDFESVRKFVGQVQKLAASLAGNKGLRLLFNNAGILRWQGRVYTKDGFEEHLQANHLGHFLLTRELGALLGKSNGARVVAVGSHLADYARIRWDNFNDVDGFEAYKQSKLMNLLMTVSLHATHAASRSLYAFTIDPGEVNTGITRHFPFASFIDLVLKFMPERKTPDEGADSALYCGLCEEEEAQRLSGNFIRERQIVDLGTGTGSWFSRMTLSAVMRTDVDVGSHGPEAAQRLWSLSESLVDSKMTLPMPPPDVALSLSSLWELLLALAIVFAAMFIAVFL